MAQTITPEEIREIRGMYGLTQRSFAALLGIGMASMVRYEQGSEPSKANANLIRAARHPEFMRECLERDGKLIPEKQRKSAERIVYACISLDEEDSAPGKNDSTKSDKSTMSDVYHYTLQQEVLNEQAANIIGDIIAIKNSTGFPGYASEVFEMMMMQVALLKPQIINASSMNDSVLREVRGYLNCVEDTLKRYCGEVGL